MSQHPSLRSSGKDKQHRSVLKRYERLKLLKDKEKWEEKNSVFGLPKVKVVRFKIKKEKAVAAESAEVAASTPGSEATLAAQPKAQGIQAKTASASAKGAASKDGARPGGEAKK